MADFKQRDDGSVAIFSESEGFDVGRAGGPKSPTNGTGAKYRAVTRAVIPMASTVTATNGTGAVATWGPFGEDRLISFAAVYISTTTPTCTLDLGVAATATTFGNNLISNLPTTSLGVFDNITNKGASGATNAYLTAGQYVVCTPAHSANTLAGNIYIDYTAA